MSRIGDEKMQSIAALGSKRLRMLFALTRVLTRLGLYPTTEKFARWPLVRRAAIAPAAWMTLPIPEVAITRNEIAGRGGAIPMKRFSPAQPDERRLQVLFIHGGGWMSGGVDSLDYLCAHVCERLGAEVTAVGYRLAPEHPYPAAIEDCEDALDLLAQSLGPIVVMGDSAGGNLAAALCLRSRGRHAIVRQVLIYPILDATLASPSMRNPYGGLTIQDLEQMVACYAGNTPPTEPSISPLLAADLSGLPPALIMTAECDPLRDDGSRYAERLRNAGVRVRHEDYPGMPHAFFSLSKLCTAAPQALELIIEELRA